MDVTPLHPPFRELFIDEFDPAFDREFTVARYDVLYRGRPYGFERHLPIGQRFNPHRDRDIATLMHRIASAIGEPVNESEIIAPLVPPAYKQA